MIEIRKTEKFAHWLDELRDIKARAKVLARIERLAMGNPGDVKPVGEGVSELRIDYGPGYRVYFKRQGQSIVILLAGGPSGISLATLRRPSSSPETFRETLIYRHRERREARGDL